MKKRFTRILAAFALLATFFLPLTTNAENVTVLSEDFSSGKPTTWTYTGNTSIQSGTLQIASGGGAGSATTPAFSNLIGATATLTFDLTSSGSNTNTLTITGNNCKVNGENSTTALTSAGNVTIAITEASQLSTITFSAVKSGGCRIDNVLVYYTTGGGVTTYNVNIANNITGGSILASPTSQEAGQLVTLTATPNSAYMFNNNAANWSVTYGDETVQVTPGDNNTATFEMPESDVTVSATFTAKPTHSITIANDIENGSVTASPESAYEGQTVTLTVNPSQGYELTNITVEDQSGNNVELIGYTFVMPNSNVFVNATFDLIPTTVSDELDRVFTGVASGAGYSSWSNKTGVSGAVYAGRSAGGNNSIQLRDSDNSGIISTTSGGKLRAVNVTWNNNTANGRTLDIYGSNTAYTATSDLYSSNTQGTKLGSIVKGTSTLSITGNYKYIGIRSNNGAMYLDEIKIQWVQTNDPSILAGNVSIEYNANSGAIEYEINNPATGGTVTAEVTNGNWLTLGEVTDGAVAFTCSSNGSYASRPATVVLTYTYGNNQTTTATVTVTQAGAPYPATNYTLATSIESGRHYIISDGSTCAMGKQNENNRAAVGISFEGETATVETYDVYEFVINGPDKDGFYTIYDAREPGYLYAVGGTSNNHLKTETFCQDHGRWTISFDAETHAASVVANISGRNKMRYNSSSSIFSCYASGQSDIFLYVKEDETNYTFYKDITGYGTSTGGYVLVASPVSSTTPAAAGMITDDNSDPNNRSYDLYYFDQSAADGKEWINYRQGEFGIEPGKGYLYANKNDVTLTFTGTAYDDYGEISLDYDGNENIDFPGLNLIGNPFGTAASLDYPFYRLNPGGSEVNAETESGTVNAMEGVFVIAEEDPETGDVAPAHFDASTTAKGMQMNINVNNGNSMVDRAIVRFDGGRTLTKFQINPNNTKIYVTEGNKDYAIVRSAAEAEMPVSFRASENGTYTLAVEAENVEMNYLHLIDNLTGMDVDLLQTPSYTFEAKTSDYASRFRLVFKANGTNENNAETFAYFNGTNWTVSNVGDATLQVVDVTGRTVANQMINGNAELNLNQPAGVYVIRLVNGDNVKTQKVVVR